MMLFIVIIIYAPWMTESSLCLCANLRVFRIIIGTGLRDPLHPMTAVLDVVAELDTVCSTFGTMSVVHVLS